MRAFIELSLKVCTYLFFFSLPGYLHHLRTAPGARGGCEGAGGEPLSPPHQTGDASCLSQDQGTWFFPGGGAGKGAISHPPALILSI